MYIQTYIHIYTHTYIHTVHTYIRNTYIHTYTGASHPYGMAVDGHGYLYASFQHTDVVLRFNSSNNFRVRKKIWKIIFSFVIIFVIVCVVCFAADEEAGWLGQYLLCT